MTLTIKTETDDDGFISASMKGSGFLLTTIGESIDEVEHEMRCSLDDYLDNEGKSNAD